MQTAIARTGRTRRNLSISIMAFVAAVLAGGVLSLPASADEWHGNEHQMGRQMERHHDDRGRYRHDDYRLRSYSQPSYIYAPPPAYYEMPPGPPVIDFVFPLRFR